MNNIAHPNFLQSTSIWTQLREVHPFSCNSHEGKDYRLNTQIAQKTTGQQRQWTNIESPYADANELYRWHWKQAVWWSEHEGPAAVKKHVQLCSHEVKQLLLHRLCPHHSPAKFVLHRGDLLAFDAVQKGSEDTPGFGKLVTTHKVHLITKKHVLDETLIRIREVDILRRRQTGHIDQMWPEDTSYGVSEHNWLLQFVNSTAEIEKHNAPQILKATTQIRMHVLRPASRKASCRLAAWVRMETGGSNRLQHLTHLEAQVIGEIQLSLNHTAVATRLLCHHLHVHSLMMHTNTNTLMYN